MTDPFVERAIAQIAAFHGIVLPDREAERSVADLVGLIKSFEALRGTIGLEDLPLDFAATLHALREE